MRIALSLSIILCMFLTCCNREGQGGAEAESTLVVTGEIGGGFGSTRGVRAGTATSKNSDNNTYVYVLLIKYPIGFAATVPPSKGRSLVDQGAGVIETVGNAVMDTRFVLKDQTLVINQVGVDLKRGSIVVIEMGADRKVTIVGQCTASAPFNDDIVKYVKELESKCAEVANFLK